MKRALVLAFSKVGLDEAQTISQELVNLGFQSEALRCPAGGLQDIMTEYFSQLDALVFVASCGLTVRAISPHIKSKVNDPAVLVVDEAKQFVISLLSGHLGGANELCRSLATRLAAIPVITTATDVHGLFSIDDWARRQSLTVVNPEKIVEVSRKILGSEPVYFISDYEIAGDMPEGVYRLAQKGNLSSTSQQPDFYVGSRPRRDLDCLKLVKPCYSLGIGCRKDIPIEKIENFLNEFLADLDISPRAIFRLASIDLKVEEKGILDLAQDLGVAFVCFSADELNQVRGAFSSSNFVRQVTGTDNVCERAALAGLEGAKLEVGKRSSDGITLALARVDRSLEF